MDWYRQAPGQTKQTVLKTKSEKKAKRSVLRASLLGLRSQLTQAPCPTVRCTEPRDEQTGLHLSPASPRTRSVLQANCFNSLTLSICPSMGFPGGSDSKESASNAWFIETNIHRDPGSQGAGCEGPWSRIESDMTEQLTLALFSCPSRKTKVIILTS